MKQLTLITILIALCSLLCEAQIPRTLSYQGVLTDSAGTPRVDASYNFAFSLYDSGNGGTPLWTEEKPLLTKRGLFSTTLGDVTPFPDSLRFDRPYWLNISVSGIGELSPRIPLTSVGYSMNALRADTAGVALTAKDLAWSVSSSNVYRLNGYVGIGTINGGDTKLVVDNGGGASRSLTLEHHGSNFIVRPVGAGSQSTVIENTGGGSLCMNPTFGNIGIGTVTPEARLTVHNTAAAGHLVLTAEDNGIADNTRIDVDFRVKNTGHTVGRIASFYSDSRKGGFGGLRFYTRYSGALDERMRITQAGNVGIGTTDPSAKLEVAGRTKTQVLEITGGSDLAEPFEITNEETLPAGTVVIIDKDNPGKLKQSTQSYDKRVAGVISGAGGINPGLTLNQQDNFKGGQHVALSGKVYVRATTVNGQIEPGDLLTTSNVAGHAMKATDKDKSFGTVIGKAMSSLKEGEGLVLVLVNLQ